MIANIIEIHVSNIYIICIYNLILITKVKKMLQEESKLREEHWEERLKHSEQLTFTRNKARNAIIV